MEGVAPEYGEDAFPAHLRVRFGKDEETFVRPRMLLVYCEDGLMRLWRMREGDDGEALDVGLAAQVLREAAIAVEEGTGDGS